jgi:hypothetical protein
VIEKCKAIVFDRELNVPHFKIYTGSTIGVHSIGEPMTNRISPSDERETAETTSTLATLFQDSAGSKS